jgi:hypothetical protein
VQKQIGGIEKNFQKITELSLFEQRVWQDFNTHNVIKYKADKLILQSDIDTIVYTFHPDVVLRDRDSVPVKAVIAKLFYEGQEVKSGYIDAIIISGEAELPNYSIFVSAKMDGAHYMNKDGF